MSIYSSISSNIGFHDAELTYLISLSVLKLYLPRYDVSSSMNPFSILSAFIASLQQIASNQDVCLSGNCLFSNLNRHLCSSFALVIILFKRLIRFSTYGALSLPMNRH